MNIGDVVPTKRLRVVIQEGGGWLDFKAPDGKQFMLLLLGVEDIKKGERLDFEAVLNELGWVRQPDASAFLSAEVKP